MEALFAIVPVIVLIAWLGAASLRHERRRLDRITDEVRRTSTPEQRAREAYDDLSTEW
jgi:hypothetical protein